MGSHAKPRTTGRKTAVGALALGATLTGVGLTAAALDPATAVLTASSADEGGITQLSGLSTPVAMNLTPTADSISDLSSAPLDPISTLTNGTAAGALQSVGSAAKTATSGTLQLSTKSPGAQTAIKPIAAGRPVGSSTAPATASAPGSTSPSSTGAGSSDSSGSSSSGGSGYTGRHRQSRSATPPDAVTPLTSTATSVLPLLQNLVGGVPVVGDLVQGSGATGTAAGALQTASGTGQSALAVPNLASLTGGLL